MFLSHFLFFVTDITGPIILQSYRVIADYEKNSKSELSVKDGNVVDVVEKTENGNLLFKENLCLISWTAVQKHNNPIHSLKY